MQNSPLAYLLMCCSILASKMALAQIIYTPQNAGYINFNLGKSTLAHTKYQEVSLFGCNTSIVLKETALKKGLEWDTKNQVLAGIPQGYQVDSKTGETYYVSKYYIASPPVFKNTKGALSNPNTIYDIGIVTPDEFVFNGEKPVQAVYMDYNILKPMHIDYISVMYDSTFNNLGVSFVPFKVECKDFPWLNLEGIENAKGASGIGSITKPKTGDSKLFLPYYFSENNTQVRNYLDCDVTILNDILFHYEVFFIVEGKRYSTINLKTYHEKFGNAKLKLGCEYRAELPCGCLPPEYKKPYQD